MEQGNANPLQDAKRPAAGLGSDDDRPLGDDAKRSDDRIRPAAGNGYNPATIRRIGAESAEGADEKVDGTATKQTL